VLHFGRCLSLGTAGNLERRKHFIHWLLWLLLQAPSKIQDVIERVVRKYSLGSEPSDVEYWMTKTPEERIAAVEVLRRQMIGEPVGTGSRLQRVLTVISR